MAILPIPTTRVSDYLARTRLIQQTQSDQLDLFRLQNQISTGRRITRPSEDGRAALRSITLQRTLERKGQLQVNLNSAQSTLATAEASLNGVGTLLNDIRAEALGVAGTTATDTQRLATRTNVFDTLERLVGLANSSYQENFLFAGSRSLAQPYVLRGGYVEYLGNETSQQQRVDTGVLFDTNIPGNEAFGGLSQPVRGSSGLSPHITTSTRLSSLNGGEGLTAGGALQIAYVPDGSVFETESVTIDLSGARTIGDVIRAIETGGPPSAELRVSVTGSGLTIETNPDSATPGAVIIREVAAGRTAAELGVLSESPATTIAGGDLDPRIGLTTQLDSLLGTKSQARLSLAGDNNDLILTANVNGVEFNGTEITVVDGAPASGSETAVFTPGSPPTLVITIADGESTAQDVAAAINAEATGAFTARIDYRDALTTQAAGTNTVNAVTGLAGVTDNSGAGEPLDLASGLLVTNGGAPFVIDTSEAETVEDLLNVLNKPENGLFAEINASGTGIDIRTRRSGADFTIGENGGALATQLGVRTYTGETRLEDFNRGAGVIVDDDGPNSNQFTIEITDAGITNTYQVDLSEAFTVQAVIDQIAADTGGVVTAGFATTGNGLVLSTGIAAVPVAVPAVGAQGLGADTLTFTAAAGGVAGNQTFSVEVIDSGAGGLSTSVTTGGSPDNVIVVDLGGSALETTATIAASIDAQLAGFTVASDGTDPVAAAVASQSFSSVGGLDASGAGADSITVTGATAQRLGFFTQSADPQAAVSTTGSIASDDRHTLEVDSVFNSLLRLAESLLGGDEAVPQIGEAITRLDDDLDRVTAARGELGSRLKALDSLEVRLEDEEVELRSSLSEELDVDLTEAISNFAARQFSLQASLQTTANLLQLSILNFI